MYFAAESWNRAANCLQQGLSWEAACFSASQTIPRFLRTTNVRRHVHSSLPLVSVLSQMKPICSLSSYCCNISTNIILLPVSRSCKWFSPHCPPKPYMHVFFPNAPPIACFLVWRPELCSTLKCCVHNPPLTSSTSGPQHPEPVFSAG
jgi:hypothetical protein